MRMHTMHAHAHALALALALALQAAQSKLGEMSSKLDQSKVVP